MASCGTYTFSRQCVGVLNMLKIAPPKPSLPRGMIYVANTFKCSFLSLSLSAVNFGVLRSRIAVNVAAAGATFPGRAWRGDSFASGLANFRFVEKTVKHACLEKFASFTFC